MRHTSRALAALAVFAVLGAAVVGGCGGATAAQPASPSPSASPPTASPSALADITGIVRDLMPGGDAGTVVLLVVADPDVASAYDRASVRVGPHTTVWSPAGEDRTELSVDDLAEGQRVAVWFAGPVAESYPVQASAGEAEILAPLR
jgi:hypothetical protein